MMRRLPCVCACALAVCRLAAQDAVSMTIDAGREAHPISPWIYGSNQVNFEGRGKFLTFTRMGGNRLTAYNWVNNASNAGTDWHNQSDNMFGGAHAGEPMEKAAANAFAHHAGIVMTVPMCGYVAADKLGGGDVNKTPDYLKTRFVPIFARKGAPFVYPPDLTAHKVYEDEFVAFMEKRFPAGADGQRPPLFYCLDNEPALWPSTHPRIHPDKVRYDELIGKTLDYAAAIKDVAPKALIFGPTEYGWQGFVRLQDAPDAANRDFIEVYLDAMAAAERKTGRRLLDVLDLHWYPEAQGGGKRIVTDESSPALIAARVQAPRSLWDPTYTEDSWIAKWSTKGPIRLLPLMKDKIAKHYPGTKLALTEYDYGGEGHISGGVAEADALGIFGREDLFAAALWGSSDKPFVYAGFAMYRNYDGQGGHFGDTSVHAQTSDVARTSVYAATDSTQPGRLTMVCINKTDQAVSAAISVAGRFGGAAQVWQLTAANSTPQRAADVAGLTDLSLAGGSIYHYTMPPMSVSTLVVGGKG